jgi:hypothetical protein
MAEIHELPQQPLDRLAIQIKRDWYNCEQGILKTEDGRKQWRDGAYNLCLHLAEARKFIGDGREFNVAFGNWCHTNGFGKDVINEADRIAAISMGRRPKELRDCLDKTSRRSIQTIYANEFSSATNISGSRTPPPPPRRTPAPTPKTNKAREAVRAAIEKGEAIDRTNVAAQAGVSEQTVQRAIYQERGRLEGIEEAATAVPPIDREEMSPSMKARYDAAVRAMEKKFERDLADAKISLRAEITTEIMAKVNSEYNWLVENVAKRCAYADKIEAGHKGYISTQQMRILKAGFHPDAGDDSTFRQQAFLIISDLEDILVKPEPTMPAPPPVPRTVDELLRQKYRMDQERREKRAREKAK